MDLTSKKCTPCKKDSPPLNGEEEDRFYREIPTWEIAKETHHILHKAFKFNNFKQAIKFVNEIATLAEEEGHHPDIHISYNKVQLIFFTHIINGLSENDFIMAAKIDTY